MRYAKPQIQEMLCELASTRQLQWDPRLTASFYDSVRSYVDGNASVDIQPPAQDIAGGTAPNLGFDLRNRFLSSDSTRAVLSQPGRVSAHRIGAYEGWEQDMRQFVRDVFLAHDNVYNATPYVSVSVRYINSLQIPIVETPIEDFVALAPRLPNGIPPYIATALSQVEVMDVDNEVKIGIAFGVTGRSESGDYLETILDITVGHVFEPGGANTIEAVFEKLELLHARARHVFESCIGDPMRNILGQITDDSTSS